MVTERAGRILSKMFKMGGHSVDRSLVRPDALMAFDATLALWPQDHSFVDRELLPAAGSGYFAYDAHGHGKMVNLSRKNVNPRPVPPDGGQHRADPPMIGKPGPSLNPVFAPPVCPRYRKGMAEASRIDFDDPAPIAEEEDEETLAAIDEGIRDAEAGRAVPIEEVRKLLPQWITASSSRKER